MVPRERAQRGELVPRTSSKNSRHFPVSARSMLATRISCFNLKAGQNSPLPLQKGEDKGEGLFF